MNMNTITSTVSLGLLFGLLTSLSVNAAQTETVTTSKATTYSGVVSQIDPADSTIILESEASPTPVTYTYTKETKFVDANGNVVASETIRNSAVTVEYSTEGGNTIVRKVTQIAPSVALTPPAEMILEKKTTTHTETQSD
jgi:hypothetical protein